MKLLNLHPYCFLLLPDTILQAILDTIEEETCSPKYAVLFLWASLANAVPITFWTLVFILSHKTIHDQLLKQLKEAFDEGTHDEGGGMT